MLAIVLTARVLGWQLGLARALGAILFSVIIGLLMHLIFFKEEQAKAQQAGAVFFGEDESGRPLWQVVIYFAAMVGILVFANWGRPAEPTGLWQQIYAAKWLVTGAFGLTFGFALWRFFGVKLGRLTAAGAAVVACGLAFPAQPAIAFGVACVALTVLTFRAGAELEEWREQTWAFAKQITPLLFMGVLAAGFLLGSPASVDAGIVPNLWVQALVGERPTAFAQLVGLSAIPAWLDSLWPVWANFFAAVSGALMYFATLTEVPILRGLLDSGMGQGPALALLLAGPALSLPSMLVINSVIGLKKTAVYVALVVVMSTVAGLIFGAIMI
ncbi:MAG: putative permease [Deltaproteobacteria bacterium ADurb.Bin510]|nr:MAG: putative permease [Deltaproteobacteria bacterium ADurb.Bin510]